MEFHEDGTLPKHDEVFVFGSNLAGIHGAGAARAALDKYGAEFGNGIGMQGNSYAIPTKDYNVYDTLDLDIIREFVKDFVEMTHVYPERRWFVTRVGCGLAGLKDRQIAPMFKGAINCSFAEDWRKYLA